MRDWTIMLGALGCWALHFCLIYGLASLADVSDPALGRLWASLGMAGTGAALLGVMVIAIRARAGRRPTALARSVGLGGCTISAVAIAWQSLPLLFARWP